MEIKRIKIASRVRSKRVPLMRVLEGAEDGALIDS
jgi:hypothetical protein